MQQSSPVTNLREQNTNGYGKAMAVVTTLFFMWGFLTCLNDILVPHLKAIFDLNYAQVMLIQFSFFSAYFFVSVPSGKILAWIGYKKTMVLGLVTMGIGALLFLPAASIASYPLFLAALMVLASGITLLQVSANPYVAVLGPPATAASRLNLTQAINSLGHTIAPYIGGLLILTGAAKTMDEIRKLPAPELEAYRQLEASSVKIPYLGLAITLFLLAILIARFRLPVIAAVESAGHKHTSGESIWRHRHLTLGVVGIFLYVGAEVAIGSFLVNYFLQPEIGGGLTEQTAAGLVSFYWGGAMVGRFIGSALLQRLRPGKVLAVAAVMACVLVFVSIVTHGSVAMWSIILVGLFNSVMFPSIFTLAIEGLGQQTGEASGLLVTAIVGGAVIPVVEGALADRIGIQHAFVLPAVCYLYIVYYGLKGSRRHDAAAY
jgi:FHS family L-fucose permease-like MFS transporter